jgi:hypothetical protein
MLFFSISVLTLFNLLRGRGATGTVGDLGGLEIGRLLGILYCWNLLTENDGMLPGLMDGSFLEKVGRLNHGRQSKKPTRWRARSNRR